MAYLSSSWALVSWGLGHPGALYVPFNFKKKIPLFILMSINTYSFGRGFFMFVVFLDDSVLYVLVIQWSWFVLSKEIIGIQQQQRLLYTQTRSFHMLLLPALSPWLLFLII